MHRNSIHEATLARIRGALASDEPALRAEAIEALGILADVRGLVGALAHDDAYVRRSAVRGLADRPGERLTWRLVQTRFDPDSEVRCAVADALARRGGWGGWLAAHALRRIVEEDESANVRFHALVGFAATESAKVEEVLRVAMASDAERLVREMARTLLLRRGAALAGAHDPPTDEHDASDPNDDEDDEEGES